MKNLMVLGALAACLSLPLSANAMEVSALSETYLKKKLERVAFTVTGTYSDGVTRDFPVAADWDGDGKMDDGILSVSCKDGKVVSAIITPRDAASGLPRGKRQHTPIRIRGSAAATGTQIKGNWDLATMKGTRMSRGAAAAISSPVVLDQGQSNLCPA